VDKETSAPGLRLGNRARDAASFGSFLESIGATSTVQAERKGGSGPPVDDPLGTSSMVAHRKEVGGVIRSGLRLAPHGTHNSSRKTIPPYLRTKEPLDLPTIATLTVARLKRGGLHPVAI
jgi:hypothetical protein